MRVAGWYRVSEWGWQVLHLAVGSAGISELHGLITSALDQSDCVANWL